MKKLLLGFMAMLLVSMAGATTIIGTLPYTITNGQPLDATPLMANFNWIVSQVNGNTFPVGIADGGTGSTTAANARAALGVAASGANSDITSLTGLTTALPITEGGTGATTAAGAATNLSVLPLTGGTLTGGLTGTTFSGTTFTGTGAITGGSIVSNGAINLTGTLSSTKACASGYTRQTPNYCSSNTPTTQLSTPSTCTAIAAPSADAKMIYFKTQTDILAAGSAGLRFFSNNFYSDSGCTTVLAPMGSFTYEPTGVTLNSQIGGNDTTIKLPFSSTGGNIYIKYTRDSSSSSYGYYYILGYYD